MFGGMRGDYRELGDTWIFKIPEQRWYRFPPMDSKPSARFGHILATAQECVILFGGVRSDGNEPEDLKVVYKLDTDLIGYPEQGEEIIVSATPATRDTITGAMSATDILRYLVLHGCHDISNELEISHVTKFPVSSGGFGDVYCATLSNGDRVGLKCIRMLVGSTEEERKFLKRAAHELYVWSKCQHPNILELSGVMLFRDQITMVSPWVEHGHLRWFLSRHPQANRCALCVGIADGVDYMHKRGIIHGDLKPENILIAKDHTPKLTDFGNAVLSEYTLQFSHSTTTPSVSLRWTAPEILTGESKLTQMGDIYALGMIIFETATGLLPLSGARDSTIMFSVASGKVPSRPEAHIPTGVEQADRLWSVITSCWTYDASARPKAWEVKNVMDGITPEGLLANQS
ncbi:unnamed protein product [Rhizoctonia solani]|uniref:Protein kinase domain-containing protein n=1 Tax=Rhizoctonia solani TaxID=456999 RepID=A0A8H3GDL6_9AGAM|nr:unnamed protein product [Rhizoctonia solani]